MRGNDLLGSTLARTARRARGIKTPAGRSEWQPVQVLRLTVKSSFLGPVINHP